MLTGEQLLKRKQGIGGSDAAAICGVSRWKTALELYGEKISFLEALSHDPDMVHDVMDDAPTPAQRRGNLLETMVFQLLKMKYAFQLTSSDNTIVHKDYPFILAHVDGFAHEGQSILEIKTSAFKEGWGECGTDQIPNEYLCQVHHYMNVCGLDHALVVVLLGSHVMLDLLARTVALIGGIETAEMVKDMDLDLRFYHVLRNEKLSQAILSREVSFWEEYVCKRVCPQPQTMDDVKTLFPEPLHRDLSADETSVTLVDEIKKRNQEIKALEEQNEQAKKALAQTIGSYEALIASTGNLLATWKSQNRTTFDAKAFQQSMPHIYDQFLVTRPLRTLRIM